MASRKAVMASLVILGRAFAGKVDGDKAEVYAGALEDVTDAELAKVTVALVKTHEGEFIPSPATIRRAVLGDERPKLDVDRIIREIDRMGGHSPAGGWCNASVAHVRELAGNAIADAYAEVGGSRLFADDARTRDIAAAEFRRALASASGATLYAAFPPWAVANPPRLAASDVKRIGASEEQGPCRYAPLP